jgi:hypothetical protein
MPEPRAVHLTLILRKNEQGEQHPLYTLLDELVAAFHDELVEANVGLAYNDNWKEDGDGHLRLGEMHVATDLERELNTYDLIITLNEPALADLSIDQTRALLDHELSHAVRALDSHLEPIVDERGRAVYRTKKHDLEEFRDIVKRYGCWKGDIEAFVMALNEGRRKNKEQSAPASTNTESSTLQ